MDTPRRSTRIAASRDASVVAPSISPSHQNSHTTTQNITQRRGARRSTHNPAARYGSPGLEHAAGLQLEKGRGDEFSTVSHAYGARGRRFSPPPEEIDARAIDDDATAALNATVTAAERRSRQSVASTDTARSAARGPGRPSTRRLTAVREESTSNDEPKAGASSSSTQKYASEQALSSRASLPSVLSEVGGSASPSSDSNRAGRFVNAWVATDAFTGPPADEAGQDADPDNAVPSVASLLGERRDEDEGAHGFRFNLSFTNIAFWFWTVWVYACAFLAINILIVVGYKAICPYIPALPQVEVSNYWNGGPTGVTLMPNMTSGGQPHNLVPSWQFNYLAARVDDLQAAVGSLTNTLARRGGDVPPPPVRVNFFAPATGVLVDPYLTSPTRPLSFGVGKNGPHAVPRTFTDILLRRQRSSLLLRSGMGPSSVFQPWDDAGECWCAPESSSPADGIGGSSSNGVGKGKSQLGIVLPQPVVPQELVLEHIPERATLEGAAMPRDLELWVQIEDATVRARVEAAAIDAVAVAADGRPTSPSPSDVRQTFGAPRSLDESWVRVGRWRYEREGRTAGTAQSFTVPVRLDELGAPVTKLVVRTLSSWGDSKSVCIYRLKLHGLAASELQKAASR